MRRERPSNGCVRYRRGIRQKGTFMDIRQTSLLATLMIAQLGACAANPAGDEDADQSTDEQSAGAGGETAGGDGDGAAMGTEGAPGCAGDAEVAEEDVIATFEDETVGVNPAGGWVGGFYIFNDKANDPAQTAEVKAVERCAGASKFAYCTTGGSEFTTWGAGIGTDLGAVDDAGNKSTVDLSAYSGVSFWIRRNSGSMPGTVKLIMADENTAEEGGACSNAADAAATMKCDPFVTSVPLSDQWEKQTISFSTLKQGGWGKPVAAFSPEAVYGIQLQFAPSVPFDVCIDHVTLVR